MAIQLLTELCAERAATGTAGQAAEDGSGDGAERDANRAGCKANGYSGTDLTAGQCDAGTASSASVSAALWVRCSMSIASYPEIDLL